MLNLNIHFYNNKNSKMISLQDYTKLYVENQTNKLEVDPRGLEHISDSEKILFIKFCSIKINGDYTRVEKEAYQFLIGELKTEIQNSLELIDNLEFESEDLSESFKENITIIKDFTNNITEIMNRLKKRKHNTTEWENDQIDSNKRTSSTVSIRVEDSIRQPSVDIWMDDGRVLGNFFEEPMDGKEICTDK